MSRPSRLSLLATLMACAASTQSLARREIGNIPVGATAFVVCHGNLSAREDQEYISSEPLPVVIDAGIDRAALETFNGTSDTPEPLLSTQFKQYLEAKLGGAANAQCHLSDSIAAARSMLEFWQGHYGSAGNAPTELVSWALPQPDPQPVIDSGRKKGAAKGLRSRQLGAR